MLHLTIGHHRLAHGFGAGQIVVVRPVGVAAPIVLPVNLRLAVVVDRSRSMAAQAIVTPYSSMIVLVNARQEDLLRRLSEEADRFDREYEDLGETTPQNPLAVAAVPEPEEWLLLILAAGLLAWRARSRLPRRLPG